ncbi:unnamed protein product [Cylicostephanus goldi]|uniref:DNA replication factor Dna2 N-terminal domain-containing protein n=1 Tax=Cylicostephanus goldi TaxID=71465 RepID=A0A3P7N4I0_CYLGO|nr:unnamed protein product [Cylicostephanus goldi]
MLLGVIVHELFQAAIRCSNPAMVTSDWLLKQWRDCLYDEVLGELAALRLTPSQVETELTPYVDVVVDWIQSNIPGGSSYPSNNAAYQITKVHDIEENIWDPQLGIKDGVTREVRPRALELKGIINQRNNLAFYMSRLKPDLLPEPRADPRFCGKCEQASVCSFYQVAMEPAGRSSKLMYDFAKANMQHLSTIHLEYFKKWIRWIYYEWAEDKARKGNKLQDLWRKSPEER